MSFEKFGVLTWKNWTLQKRRPISGTFQVLFPIFIVLMIIWARWMFGDRIGVFGGHEEVMEFRLQNFTVCQSDMEVVFTPNNEAFTKFVNDTFGDRFEILGFEFESELTDYWRNVTHQVAAIILRSTIEVTRILPENLQYFISLNRYINENCNLMVQNELERNFLKHHSVTLYEPVMINFPYGDQFYQLFTDILIQLLPIALVFSMFASVGMIIKSVTSERESKMKELMKIMGMTNILHWSSWFLKCIILMIVSYTIVTVLLCIPIFGSTSALDYSNFFIIWLFFILFSASVITFCFMISTIFHKSSTAVNVGIMFFFSTYIPYYVYQVNFESLDYAVKWIFCIPINTSLGMGISMALNMELNKRGITFSNLFEHYEGFGFSFGEVLIVMILSSIIHLAIMTYLEMVFPGDIGVPKPWYFPIKPLVKLFYKKKEKNIIYQFDSCDDVGDFEEEPKDANPTVKIVNMSKYFGSSRVVNNLSLNMYEDQIFVLLGHNGAGKTTTMNLLVGMIPPSNGTAYINDFDITTNIEEARKSLGICPQHNILFQDMTVREHIIFFCKLKGVKSREEIEKEVDKYCDLLNFRDKKNAQARSLSGGQKRKLSIANALCGNSSFVILDEPTSGLDVNARRNLWDLLLEERKGKTILLSTHYLDEAEVLGDRIAIMNEGKLKTLGTSYFLKKKFGSGYRLIVVKNENCNSGEILQILRKFAPDASIELEEQMEVRFILSEEYLDKFDKIFKHLENEAESLGIASFGCSLTTLEEVFLKVGALDEKVAKEAHESIKIKNFMSVNEVNSFTLFWYQSYAMILKKIHFTRRNYGTYFFLFLLTAWLLFAFLAAPFEFESNFNARLSGIAQSENPGLEMFNIYGGFFEEGNFERTERNIIDFIFGNYLVRNLKFEVGLSQRTPTSFNIWYNSLSFFNPHTAALNLFHRALLKQTLGMDADIYQYFSQYPRVETTTTSTIEASTPNEIYSNEDNQFAEILIYFMLYFLLSFWMPVFITLKIKERVVKSKLLQFISGLNRFIFTFISFFLDLSLFLIIMFSILGIVAGVGRPGFNTTDDVEIYLVLFTFYGLNFIPFVHLLGLAFKKPSTGENIVSLLPFLFAGLYVAYAVLENTLDTFFSSIVYWIGLFFAPFSFIDSLSKIQRIKYFDEGDLWSFENRGFGINLVMMAVGGVLYITILLMKDYMIFTWIGYKIFNRTPSKIQLTQPVDNDVQDEIDRVKRKSKTEIAQSNLVLNGFTKLYGKHVAVNQLHIGVETAECFGLLGVNGAGKTSCFKMMTGDEAISAGNGWVQGHSMINEITKIYGKIGYCPQQDALLPELSGRETLNIFCLLRGIPMNEINGTIESFAYELGFHQYLDREVQSYSGGNKRKLSTALSLLGNLSVIFLDECSSGMDPKAKRQLWNIINKTRHAGKAVILTSHSMLECENLCTKLAIMVDGEFRCLGSIQHLKNKFSKGFVLTIKMAARDDEQHFEIVLNRVLRSFPAAELKERFMELLTFHINTTTLKWSEVFAELAEIKREIGISDFTMTQSSLESVFLFFSKQSKRKEE